MVANNAATTTAASITPHPVTSFGFRVCRARWSVMGSGVAERWWGSAESSVTTLKQQGFRHLFATGMKVKRNRCCAFSPLNAAGMPSVASALQGAAWFDRPAAGPEHSRHRAGRADVASQRRFDDIHDVSRRVGRLCVLERLIGEQGAGGSGLPPDAVRNVAAADGPQSGRQFVGQFGGVRITRLRPLGPPGEPKKLLPL